MTAMKITFEVMQFYLKSVYDHIRRPSSLNELTPIIFIFELTYLGSEISIYIYIILARWLLIINLHKCMYKITKKILLTK